MKLEGWRIRWQWVLAGAAWACAAQAGADEVRTTFPPALEREPLLLWLERETDILPGQVVAVTPQALTSVVSAFPAAGGEGPRVVIRAEALSPETQTRTGALSWHVSLNADCTRRRVRMGETTGYRERNLIGERQVLRAAETEWRTPDPGTALDHALRAACDRDFAGPFKASAVRLAEADLPPGPRTEPEPPVPAVAPEPPTAPATVRLANATVTAPPARPAEPRSRQPKPPALGRTASGFVAQIGAVSSDGEAGRLFAGLGARTAGRSTWVETADVGGRVWRRAVVGGFPDGPAAARFCADLRASGRACFVRPARPS